MGFANWLQDRWLMMMRTKPQYISALGRKRSSIRSPPKISSLEGNKWNKRFGSSICVVIMCCSVSLGILLVLFQGLESATTSTVMVSLTVAGIASISGGFCLAEYISSHAQEVTSIYSCCYQYSNEVSAFFIGWTWLVSQAATVAAICKASSTYLNHWIDDVTRNFLQKVFFQYADSVPSLIFVVAFSLFVLSGVSETMIWFIFFMPLTFLLLVTVAALSFSSGTEAWTFFNSMSWDDVQGIDQILALSALCILFFSGPQNLLRSPTTHLGKNTTAILGPLNAISLIISYGFLSIYNYFSLVVNEMTLSQVSIVFVVNIICLICLCVSGIEALYPLHFVIEDMSSDGLLFRSLSKKCKPFCFPIASPVVQVLTIIAVGLMSVFLSFFQLLNLSVVFPHLVSSIVPFLVLVQRYRDNNSWQYEPMLHASERNLRHDRSRKKAHELQFTNGLDFDLAEIPDATTACVDEGSSGSNSDTDIDAVVKQYKEQTKIANMITLEETEEILEPTSSTFIRAKFYIGALLAICLVTSITLNFAAPSDQFSVMIIVLLCLLFSTVIQALLLCLPQNNMHSTKDKCCAKVPSMPWGPGIASLISSSLLVRSLLKTWQVYFGWVIIGVVMYFTYGIRSSTAASSFHHLQSAHITLRPLPSYGHNCIPQIIPSQRKESKLKQKRVKKALL